MELLLIAATEMELHRIKLAMASTATPHTIHYLVTDVGMLATTFYLQQQLFIKKYDLVIQIGIAGAFNSELQLGDVVEVISETYGDLGAEDKEEQISIFDMNIMQQDQTLFDNKQLKNPISYTSLRKVSSLSVNNCSGQKNSIANRNNYFQKDIETMEGMALHYVCSHLQQPYLHIRAISNYVTERDKSTWNIPLALTNLSTFVYNWISHLK